MHALQLLSNDGSGGLHGHFSQCEGRLTTVFFKSLGESRKDEACGRFSLIWISALSCLQCFDAISCWLVSFIPKVQGSLLEQLEEKQQTN